MNRSPNFKLPPSWAHGEHHNNCTLKSYIPQQIPGHLKTSQYLYSAGGVPGLVRGGFGSPCLGAAGDVLEPSLVEPALPKPSEVSVSAIHEEHPRQKSKKGLKEL